jgi:hypothetical protein
MSRIYEPDYAEDLFRNCTPTIATGGEVCTNGWPLYTNAQVDALSTDEKIVLDAQMTEL